MSFERFDIDVGYHDPWEIRDEWLPEDRPSRGEVREELDEPTEETPFVDESDQEWGPGLPYDEDAGW